MSADGLGGILAHTSLSAASKWHTNRMGDEESHWGVPVVVSKGSPMTLSNCMLRVVLATSSLII